MCVQKILSLWHVYVLLVKSTKSLSQILWPHSDDTKTFICWWYEKYVRTKTYLTKLIYCGIKGWFLCQLMLSVNRDFLWILKTAGFSCQTLEVLFAILKNIRQKQFPVPSGTFMYEGVSVSLATVKKSPNINLDKNYIATAKSADAREKDTRSHLNGTQQLITSDSNIHNTKSATRYGNFMHWNWNFNYQFTGTKKAQATSWKSTKIIHLDTIPSRVQLCSEQTPVSSRMHVSF